MKSLKISLVVLVLILVLTAVPTLMGAGSASQTDGAESGALPTGLALAGNGVWQDFEATTQFTVHSTSGDWGIGLAARLAGDKAAGSWDDVGALAWVRGEGATVDGVELLGNGGTAIDDMAAAAIQPGKTYHIKLSAISSSWPGDPSTYRLKIWEAGRPEPVLWSVTGIGNAGEPASGAVALVAHNADVSWGEMSIQPLAGRTYSVNISKPANGDIIISPDLPSYSYGARVEIRSVGKPGYALGGWTGAFSGTQNRIVFDVTQDVSVGATFLADVTPNTLALAATGQGEVSASPQKTAYAEGEQVSVYARPKPGFVFDGWSDSSLGLSNPATVTMDGAKSLTATFVPAADDQATPVSDDFHACELNTGLWTEDDPVGDGTVSVDGTHALIDVPGGASHNAWEPASKAVHIFQPMANADFDVIAKYDSTVTQKYQVQGMLFVQDTNNFTRFEVHHNGTLVKVYAGVVIAGNGTPKINNVDESNTPPYLRVTRTGNNWLFRYSFNGTQWLDAGNFDQSLNLAKGGVYGANHGLPETSSPHHLAEVDYFFNTASPIDPEDGDLNGLFAFETNAVGNGDVTLDPAGGAYACGDTVTVTAVPDPGWIFSGWSGDLSSMNPSEQLVVSGEHTVTATFTEETGVLDNFMYVPMIIGSGEN